MAMGLRNLVAGPYNGFDGTIGIEYRGSSSQDLYQKKGYSIELRDGVGMDEERSLLGMPKESDWVLIGPYNDKSLMRDALALCLAGEAMDYAPRAHFIELLVNNSYQGVYLLAEKIKRDKDRVPVAKQDGNDITGGYILKFDKYTGANNGGFTSTYSPSHATFQTTDILYHYPAADEITNAQKSYIQQWMRNFENVLSSSTYRDTVTGYLPYVERQSFVDYMLINEAYRNVDAYRLSTYFYKDRDSLDGRLHMGPVWDFNIAFGLGDYCNGEKTSGWAWDHHIPCAQDTWLVPFWWERLRSDARFMHASLDRWTELRSTTLSNAHINHVIDSLQALLQESQTRNFQKWPVMGTYVWPNAYVGPNWQSEVQYLHTWFQNRMAWMDSSLVTLVSVAEYNPKDAFAPVVFPNPVNIGFFSTKIYVKKGVTVRLKLTYDDGRFVRTESQTVRNSGELTLDWTAPIDGGVYFYEIYFDNEKQSTGKLIIAH